MLTFLLTILLFSVMVIPHEFGHFAAAKLSGIKVNEFSVGMGPKIFQKQGNETKYSIRIFPIGGFCAMEGEDEESDNPRAFNNVSTLKKIFVLSSGAIMNILVALLLMIITVQIIGTPTNVVGSIEKNSPAELAGLRAGDRIVELDNKEINSWEDFVQEMRAKESEQIEIGIERKGNYKEFIINPIYKDGRQVIGVTSKPAHNLFKSAIYGSKSTWQINSAMYSGLYKMLTGKVNFKKNVAGPIGIISLVGKTSKEGFISFIYLAVIISINLAVINMLPFPALDGGRILFTLIRKITGNAISDEMEGKIHLAGFAILIALLIFVTWNDILRLIS